MPIGDLHQWFVDKEGKVCSTTHHWSQTDRSVPDIRIWDDPQTNGAPWWTDEEKHSKDRRVRWVWQKKRENDKGEQLDRLVEENQRPEYAMAPDQVDRYCRSSDENERLTCDEQWCTWLFFSNQFFDLLLLFFVVRQGLVEDRSSDFHRDYPVGLISQQMTDLVVWLVFECRFAREFDEMRWMIRKTEESIFGNRVARSTNRIGDGEKRGHLSACRRRRRDGWRTSRSYLKWNVNKMIHSLLSRLFHQRWTEQHRDDDCRRFICNPPKEIDSIRLDTFNRLRHRSPRKSVGLFN